MTTQTNEKIRWNVLLLAQMITSRSTEIMTPKLIEYRALSAVMDDDMVNVAIKMGVRKPKVFSEIQKRTGMEPEKLEAVLDRLLKTGICEFSFENPQHEKQYFVDIPVSGSAELMVANKDLLGTVPEVSEYFEICSMDPVAPVAGMIGPGGSGVGMHVIPVEKAISAENETEDVEHISYWLDKYDKFAFWPCQCRLIRQHNGENVGDDPEGWCVGLGDFADYLVETNRGVYATREEVKAHVRLADEQGFVHQVTNIDGRDKVFILCSCNVNNCLALRTSQLFNAPNLSRSAYTARVDPNNCVACGKCVEKCPAGAVKLGQKLCTTNGPVEYPKVELPDDHILWGKSRHDENYRDTNRIGVYPTGTAPCKTACPAHIAIQGYLQLAKEGRYDEALELIKKDNPFPAICGRVCNKRCEDACTRGMVDRAVAIDEVKKFLAQRDLDAETRYIPKKLIPKVEGTFDEKIAIIGGGPAGLSAAYYLALKGYFPTVFEANEKPGGMMTYGIPSYVLEKDVVEAEIEVLKELGVEIRCGVKVGEDVTIAQLREQGYKAFYLAVGCQGSRKANVPGEDAIGVESAVDFLHRVEEDHSVRMPEKVVVVGGGNVAIDAARSAYRCGAKNIEMICLEQRDEMPALPEEILAAEEEGIHVMNGWGPKSFETNEDGTLKAILFKKCTSVKNAEGRFAPTYDEEDVIRVDCAAAVLSIGQCTDWGKLLEGENVTLENGRLKLDPLTYQTTCEDIFAGGDVVTGPKFAIDAIAAGHMASEVLHRYVRVGDLNAGRDRRELIELNKSIITLSLDQYDRPARQEVPIDTSISHESFHDPRLVFTEEQVKLETSRCLSCGASIVDENKCIGCGVCTNQCMFDAIHLHRTHPENTNMMRYEERMKGIGAYMVTKTKNVVKRKIREL